MAGAAGLAIRRRSSQCPPGPEQAGRGRSRIPDRRTGPALTYSVAQSLRTPGASGMVYMANAAKIGGGAKVLMDLVLRLDPGRFRPGLVAPDSGPLTEWGPARSKSGRGAC